LGYLAKGLASLSKLFDEANATLEDGLRASIVQTCLDMQDTHRFDPYSISKIMRYVSRKDSALDQATLRLYSLFGKELVETVSQR